MDRDGVRGMIVKIYPGKISGKIDAIPSKSHLHRILIYSALSLNDTHVFFKDTNAEDITATIDCLTALGADFVKNENGLTVSPINRKNLPAHAVLPCCESGSTLRFLLPVVSALGVDGSFERKGRLAERPMELLTKQMENHGVTFRQTDDGYLHSKGQLQAGEFFLPGDVSSQYITGLLMALPLLKEGSVLTVATPIESADYIEITQKTAKDFGVKNVTINSQENIKYVISPTDFNSKSTKIVAEGDWSNSAFWLCAGAMPCGEISVSGLEKTSTQGDRYIAEILTKMGAKTAWEGNTISVKEGNRKISEIDGKAIPDLIPVLAAVASVGEGTTIFKNAQRLRIKESDRLKTTTQTLKTLGADIKETNDGLIVNGKKTLNGGEVHAHGDHRIAMMAAIASTACLNPVTVTGAQAVNKSYPSFWEDLKTLGKKVEVM